jgi:hypothetical protein
MGAAAACSVLINMPTLIEKVKSDFVDRQPELTSYQKITGTRPDQLILCINAEDGWGKTYLLTKLFIESDRPELFRAKLNLDSYEAANAVFLLEAIGRQMKGVIQAEMDREGPPGAVNIEAGGDVNIHGDVISGSKYVVNYSGSGDHPKVEVSDPYAYAMRVNALTVRFQNGLRLLQPPQMAILFLDIFEKITDKTMEWLKQELFPGLYDGRFEHLAVIVAGNCEFSCFEDRELSSIVERHRLTGLPEDSIKEYWLQRCHLPEQDLPFVLRAVLGNRGDPSFLSTLADGIQHALAGQGGGSHGNP